MRSVKVNYLTPRIHQAKGQRLEITATAQNVVLFVLRQIYDLSPKTEGLGIHFFADRVLTSRPERTPNEVSWGLVMYSGMCPSSWRYPVTPIKPMSRVLSPNASWITSAILSGISTSGTRLWRGG